MSIFVLHNHNFLYFYPQGVQQDKNILISLGLEYKYPTIDLII